MTVRETLLLLILTAAGLLVTVGVHMIYQPAGVILGGLLLGVLGMVVLYDDGRPG